MLRPDPTKTGVGMSATPSRVSRTGNDATPDEERVGGVVDADAVPARPARSPMTATKTARSRGMLLGGRVAAAVVTREVSQPARRWWRHKPQAATKRRTGPEPRGRGRARWGAGTTRNGVEGRQPNDRREAGVPVAGDRDRPGATGRHQPFGWARAHLPMCLQILRSGGNQSVGGNHCGASIGSSQCVSTSCGAAATYSGCGVDHSRRWSAGTCSASV